MFRCILYFKPANHATGELGYAMSSTGFPTWEQAAEVLNEWYATKCRSGKYEVCGGNVEQKVEGVGWCVCDQKPDEPFEEEDDIVVILGPIASWL